MADVGIFWFYQNQPIIAAVPLTEGADDGLFINGPYDHVDFWDIVQRKYPHLRVYEYHQIPRGRVLFSKQENKFFVYMDKTLFRPRFVQTIHKSFHLPPAQTAFMTDVHYTTDPHDLDKLFSE